MCSILGGKDQFKNLGVGGGGEKIFFKFKLIIPEIGVTRWQKDLGYQFLLQEGFRYFSRSANLFSLRTL